MKSIINFCESEEDYQKYLAIKNRDRVVREAEKSKPLADKIGGFVKKITSPLEAGAKGITAAITGQKEPKAEPKVVAQKAEDSGLRDTGTPRMGPVDSKPSAPPTQLAKKVSKPVAPKPVLSKNDQLMAKAKQDATNAAIAYKKNNPQHFASDNTVKAAQDNAPVKNASMTPSETERKVTYASTADTAPKVTSASMTPSEMRRKIDYASVAGNAVSAAKKAGGSILDKIQKEAPGIIEKGKELLGKVPTMMA